MMRFPIPMLAVFFSGVAIAGESSLTKTYQPLSGLGADGIHIREVWCHDWYSHGSMTTAIGLISAKNVPPTNNPINATHDINLASVHGIRFRTNDIGGGDIPAMTLDLTKFKVTKTGYVGGQSKEDVLRASIECLRRCLIPELMKTPLGLKASDKDAAWAAPIVKEFNEHDRSKAFYKAR